MLGRWRGILALSLSVSLHAAVIYLGGFNLQNAGGGNGHLSVSVAPYQASAGPVAEEAVAEQSSTVVPATVSEHSPGEIQPSKPDIAPVRAVRKPVERSYPDQTVQPRKQKPAERPSAQVVRGPVSGIADKPVTESPQTQVKPDNTKAEAVPQADSLDGQTGQGDQTASSSDKIGLLKPDVMAVPLYRLIPKPSYPSRSRDLGEEGTVIVAILVAKDGSVASAYLDKSSGYPLLDGSALRTVREKWKFKPATRAGVPMEAWVRVPIKFSIDTR